MSAGSTTTTIGKRPLRFLFIRHGESASNVDRAHHLTVPDEIVSLTSRGFEQVENTGQFAGKFLVSHPLAGKVSLFYSSYQRTRQTAQYIFDGIKDVPACQDIRVQELDLLVEHQVGYLTGLTETEMQERYQYEIERFNLHWNNGSRQFAPFYGGEPWLNTAHRAHSFLNIALREHEKHDISTIFVVGHGGLTQQINKLLLKLPHEGSDKAPTLGNGDVRLLQRFGDNNENFGDFGSICQNGQPQQPCLQSYPTAADRLKAGTYRR